MTLPASGAISLSQVNTELGRSSTAAISLNDSAVRTLFGKASGAISMSDGYGKANQFSFSFAGGTNVNLRSAALAAGWNGSSKVVATNTGTITSGSTGSAALTISGSFPGGVQFINNSYVVGRGGNGGTGGNGLTSVVGAAGGGGGTAMAVSTPVTVTNNGVIGGGGGGGGGGAGASDICAGGFPGNGGGGGAGYGSGAGAIVVDNRTGGAGAAGSLTGGGAGGTTYSPYFSGAGGTGGGLGASGGGGAGGLFNKPSSGGGGGYAVTGNGNISWTATGSLYGAIG